MLKSFILAVDFLSGFKNSTLGSLFEMKAPQKVQLLEKIQLTVLLQLI